MKRVLVTGAAGFIGSTLVDILLQRGDEVIGLDNFNAYYDPSRKRHNLAAACRHPLFRLSETDIRSGDELEELLASEQPEAVVHLAAAVGNRRSLTDADDFTGVNVLGTANLLRACRHTLVRSFVFVSTANIYNDEAPTPCREGMTADRPRTPYAQSKKEGELLVLAARQDWGLPATLLRLFTVYGPRQRPDMGIYKFCQALQKGEEVPLIGQGSEERDYLFVSDGVEAIYAALGRAAAGEIINVGSGQASSTNNLLAILCRLLHRPLRLRRLEADRRDTRRSLADITKAERLLSWKPSTDLHAGLVHFLHWWQGCPTNSARPAMFMKT